MRLVSQRIQKKNVEVAQLLNRFRRHRTVIGEIGGRSETKAQNRRFTVNHRHRLKVRAKQVESAIHRDQLDLWQSSKFVVRLEDVAEHVAQELAIRSRRIERQLAKLVVITKRAQVVDPKNMVGMRMRVEHRIELRDVLAQRLFAKIGSCIDQNMMPVVAEQNGRPGAAVVRVTGTADGAVAANR